MPCRMPQLGWRPQVIACRILTVHASLTSPRGVPGTGAGQVIS